MKPNSLVAAADTLAKECAKIKFAPPVAHTYQPLLYARKSHRKYLQTFGDAPKQILFLGMNPGPWGMAQTGVPFGEVAAVRDWMKISETISAPPNIHPRRPIFGFDCPRSEVSGRRLWGMFAAHYPQAKDFFAAHFVLNYCPLLFLAADAKNITPDKLRAADQQKLFAACDRFLQTAVGFLQPKFCIGIGNFAESRLRFLFADSKIQIGKILHPSPANPAANKNYARSARSQLQKLGAWN